MRHLSSPVTTLEAAIKHAAEHALDPIDGLRPETSECEVLLMHPQQWGSTALGFGGIGGAAMTWAYTIAIEGPNEDVAIYFGSRFAYRVSPHTASMHQWRDFLDDLGARRVQKRQTAAERYGATQEVNPPPKPAAQAPRGI